MKDRHYRILWYLTDGTKVVGATMYPSKETAEAAVQHAFSRQQHWSQRYEIIEAFAGGESFCS